MITRAAVQSAAFGVLALAGGAWGVVTEYTVEGTWATAAGGVVRVINFDDAALAQGATLAIATNRYAALAGAPSLVGVASATGSGAPLMYRANAIDAGNGVIPTSGQNVLHLTSIVVRNGILRITFNQPVVAVSGRFIDIETVAASNTTGFRVGGALNAVNLSNGNGFAQFYGVVSTVPFTSVDLELDPHVFPVADGLVFDDFQWVLKSDCVGDVNSDGFTNISDFNILASNFGASGRTHGQGDLTGDGFVNISDFNLLAGDFGCVN